ncbi:MAG: hypothetical protein ACKO67_01685 [Bacteroidota bacterium]
MNNEAVFYVGIGIALVTTLLGRVIRERGLKTLNAEELHNLMTSFAKTRMVSVYVLFGIIAAYLILGATGSFEKLWAMGINTMYVYFGLLIVYVFVTQGMGIARMRKMTLPAAYMKSVYQSAVLQVVGIVSIAVGLMMYL